MPNVYNAWSRHRPRASSKDIRVRGDDKDGTQQHEPCELKSTLVPQLSALKHNSTGHNTQPLSCMLLPLQLYQSRKQDRSFNRTPVRLVGAQRTSGTKQRAITPSSTQHQSMTSSGKLETNCGAKLVSERYKSCTSL